MPGERSLLRSGTTKSLNAALLEAVRSDILTGVVEGGVKLKIPDLCATYGVSPGAAREALSRLVSEGLVDFVDQRGFRSAPVTPEGLRDTTRVRMLIETEALVDAMRHGDEAWEGAILSAQHLLAHTERTADPDPRASAKWALRHKEFHQALVAACTSPWLLRLHALFYDQTERYRVISRRMETSEAIPPRTVSDEHEQIVRAVLARDETRAIELMREHLDTTMRRVLDVISKHSPSPAG
jgi:DNA-binding GntR family transcriptional regulator